MAESLQSRGYLPVATATLVPSSMLGCDLYVQRPGRTYAELWRGSTYPLEAADIAGLVAGGIDHLYVRAEAAKAYGDYLREHVLRNNDVSPKARMQALREVTRVAFQEALVANDCDRMVNLANSFGGDMAMVLAYRTVAFRELFTMLEHDYYLFTHACNVSVYCAILASKLGTCDVNQFGMLVAGGLLHDIGKRHIPLQVLNKLTKLTDKEWELIRQHPHTGYQEVAERGDMSWGQLMMIYQHHERLDGSGYPTGIPAEEIHPWAKICMVADVFDAMTCQRPYRRPLPTGEACKYLKKYAGIWFDAEVVDCWSSHVASAT